MKYSVVVALLVLCAITLALGVHAQDAPEGTQHDQDVWRRVTRLIHTKLTDVSVPATGPKSVGIVSSDAKLAAARWSIQRSKSRELLSGKKRCGNGPQRTKGSPLYEGYIDENAFTHLSMIFATAFEIQALSGPFAFAMGPLGSLILKCPQAGADRARWLKNSETIKLCRQFISGAKILHVTIFELE